MPIRIQRQRKAGWRMPENARYVGRPSGWGNPFVPGQPYRFIDSNGSTLIGVGPRDRSQLVALFRRYIEARPDLHAEIRHDLANWDLACWCPLDEPCHADVLLSIANPGVSEEDRRANDADSLFVDTQDAATRYREDRQ